MNGRYPEVLAVIPDKNKKIPELFPGSLLGNQWGSNPRPSESQSDALTN